MVCLIHYTYHLCLAGIQQYLYENGRIDDIFSNFYYEGYTDALNEVLAGYEIRLNAHGMKANNLHDSIGYKKQIPSQCTWYEDQQLS